MKTELLTLEKLQDSKSGPCVSIILPTHKTSPERTVDRIEMKKVIEKTSRLLLSKEHENGSVAVLQELENLSDSVDFVHNQKGIGLFVSPEVSEVVKFPFDVKEKISVGNDFELRELLYLQETTMPYYVLTINGKKVRLFSGQYDQLREVKDKNFPSDFYDDYIYSKPSVASSYGHPLKSTEKDKSIVKENRFMAHLKKSDHKLSQYSANRTPFIICGNPKDLGYFLKVYSNHINIIGKIQGDYSHNTIDILAKLAAKKISYYIGREQKKLIKQVNESIGKQLAVTGLREVWKAAMEGRGLTLLIEKDFHNPGYVKKNSLELFMRPPVDKSERLNDATKTIVKEILAKKGKVVVVDNGKLDAFNKIALLLRY